MAVKSGMKEVSRPWTSLVGALDLREQGDPQDSAITDLVSNYQYGLETMTRVAVSRIESLRPVFAGFSTSRLRSFALQPGASQVIWWAKEGGNGNGAAPDLTCVEYLVERSTHDDSQSPEVVTGPFPFF